MLVRQGVGITYRRWVNGDQVGHIEDAWHGSDGCDQLRLRLYRIRSSLERHMAGDIR